MNVEPIHQLASAIHSSPKLFACVLGSGISRSADIKTGWEIVLDLVQRHAEQVGEGDACAKDGAKWYAAKYGHEPDYSEVVSRLATTTDLRRNLLERYFTVLDEVTSERREHEPTPAHRSIAKLVQRGLLRVIVTTNFDRLMERALRDAGVARVEVVSSEADAADSYPFHAAEAFVFKIHGDWRDTWLRNSREELASYSPATAKLLQRIVDEHGLVVCGWSAEYDIALREAIARRERRFPIHWVDPKPGAGTQRIVAELKATHVAAVGDAYFSELELAVAALDRQRPPASLSADVLVARAKRFIATNNEMELDDLVQDATRSLCRWIETEFDPARGAPEDQLQLSEHAESVARACEAQVVPLARLLVALARYAQPSYLAQRSLSALLRSAHARIDGVGGYTLPKTQPHYVTPEQLQAQLLCQFHAFPALLCAYAWGVACGAKSNWRGAITAVRDAGSGRAANEVRFPPSFIAAYVDVLYPYRTPQLGELLESQLQRLLSFANRLAAWLFPHLEDWIPRRTDFARAFDRFDVLMAVFGTRIGTWGWMPRCAVPRTSTESDDAARATFDETVESWLLRSLGTTTPDEQDLVLREAFHGSSLAERTDAEIFNEIRSWSLPSNWSWMWRR